MKDSNIYFPEHRAMQEMMGSVALADKMEEMIIHDTFSDEDVAFITSREMFFLSTIGSGGEPTVSYKGGPVGFVKIEENELIFPNYDGNGMFLSIGNLVKNPQVGLLFINFETPHRLRVQGTAVIDANPDLQLFPGAQFLVRIKPNKIWVNCTRYIPTFNKVSESPYTPDKCKTPKLAEWKRIDAVYDSLSASDKVLVDEQGLITIEEYGTMVSENKA
ncbi:MAG TPA: pyridoxamine 5'-phosphate oxidase family protein [Methylophilus sp.]|nr:pyridoxamine 5'-phosphate oxidase family protein [Methylophilus sp.]